MMGFMSGNKFPNVQLGLVDVQDVVTTHFLALEKGKNGSRYICTDSKKQVAMPAIAAILKEEFKDSGYEISTDHVGSFKLWIGKLFNQDAKFFYFLNNEDFTLNNEKSIRELGMTYKDGKKSLIELAHHLIDIGLIPDKRKKE